MSPATLLWMLEKASTDLEEAREYERDAKRLVGAMMQRQRGEDGWDPDVWRGEGTKAKRKHAAILKRRDMIAQVVTDLRVAAGLPLKRLERKRR